MKRTAGFVAAGTIGAVALLGGGVASAFWLATGSNSGASAQVGTTDTDFIVAVSVDTSTPLSPGGALQTITYTVTNPDPDYALPLHTVSFQVANPDGSAWSVGTCDAWDFRFDASGWPTYSPYTVSPAVTLAANDGGASSADEYSGTLTIQMIDDGTNQEDCKNQAVPLLVKANS